MPHQRQFDTPTAILRRFKEGCGSGEGPNYKPYIQVSDFYSTGRRLRTWSSKFGRTMHYFSGLETTCGYLAEYLPEVVANREQFPLLPWGETEAIARELGIRHPKSPRTKFPVVMTTDQVWNVRNNDGELHELALTVKYSRDRDKPRNREKRKIEEIFHARRGRQLLDFDEFSVGKDFLINWSFIRDLLKPERADVKRDELASLIDRDFRQWVFESSPLQRELILKVSRKLGANPADILTAYYSLIASRQWPLDIFTGCLGPKFTCRFLTP